MRKWSYLWRRHSIGMHVQGSGQTCGAVTGSGYKYKEVARKRAEREAMLGVECPDCQRFYEACQTWNSIAPAALPQCGHAIRGRQNCTSVDQ